MPIYILDNKLWFPPASEADSEGLLAMGGDLTVDRLLIAYKNGITSKQKHAFAHKKTKLSVYYQQGI